MSTDMLEVFLDGDIDRERVPLPISPSSYVDLLVRNGFGYLNIVGLGRLGARGFKGNPIDAYFMPIEHDVAFLLEHYLALEELVAERREGRLLTYVADGCLEFNAVVVGSTAHVRVGFFRDSLFEDPFADAVSIDLHAYLLMWRSFASAVVDGAHGRGRRVKVPD